MKSYILPSVPQTMNETEGYENNYSEHSLSYTYEEKKNKKYNCLPTVLKVKTTKLKKLENKKNYWNLEELDWSVESKVLIQKRITKYQWLVLDTSKTVATKIEIQF